MPITDSYRTDGGFTYGRITASAGTLINRLVTPKPGWFTRITTVEYTNSTTAHALTALRAIGQTTAASAGATGQAVLNLTAQPAISAGGPANNVAANDYLAWKNDDGTYSFDIVSSVSTLAITMTSNLPKAVAAGNPVWFFGIITDLNTDGLAHPVFTLPVSTTKLYQELASGVVQSLRAGEPILLQSSNATAAGTLERVSGLYTAI